MSPEQKRIKIAEACGWSCDADGYWTHEDLEMRRRLHLPSGCPPNYLNDLNAMHEAECTLFKESEVSKYEICLRQICGGWRLAMSATALQRAEAFGLTLNLWEASS